MIDLFHFIQSFAKVGGWQNLYVHLGGGGAYESVQMRTKRGVGV
jgi:hypothetical protein